MPPIRTVQEARKQRLLETRPVPSKRPACSNGEIDDVIPASRLREPFKEIQVPQDDTLHIPTRINPRPPPLTLADLECIKTLRNSLDGSHGKVLLVRSIRKSHHLDSECLFAFKVIPRKFASENAALEVLEEANGTQITETRKDILEREKVAEISTLVKLGWNPFIVGLIDTFYDSQNLYLALEYAPHGTLRTRLQQSLQGRMKPREAIFYFANIVAALDFIHKKGIIHRDVQPKNFLLNSDGYLCLTDFGSACSLEDIGESPKLSGTSAYTAPEWNDSTFDPELLDWWASGCILFEMATGEMAFAQKETSSGLTWPPNARVGKHLRDLIERLLVADPSKRLLLDLTKHPWLKAVNWEIMMARGYVPPFIPRPVNTAELSHKDPLPEQHVVPGLTIVEPPILQKRVRFLK